MFVWKKRNEISAIASLLQRCAAAKDLTKGKLLHAQIVSSGYGGHTYLGDQLIKMYSECGSLDEAARVFDLLPCRSLITFNFMIGAYVQHGREKEALDLFVRMEIIGIKPDAHTFSRILCACCRSGALSVGKEIHQKMLQDPSEMNTIVWNALISMYSKCRRIQDARDVFDLIPERNVVSWNSIIAAYAQHGHLLEAMEMYDLMDTEPNSTTFACVLGACCDLNKGREIHRKIVGGGWDSDAKVQNALVFMYAKCGCVAEAEDCFRKVVRRDVVSWNTMIGAYVQNGRPLQALKLFRVMDLEGVAKDSVTFTAVLGACERQQDCRSFHDRIVSSGFGSHLNVRNGMVGMYARTGDLALARSVFDGIQHKNMTSWTTMLVSYAQRGHSDRALGLYEEMKKEGVDPDFVLFPTIASSCFNLEQGRKIHDHITATGSQTVSAENALVTMYANCGCVKQSKQVFDGIVHKNFISWTAMISAFAQLGYVSEAIETYGGMSRSGATPVPITLALVLGAYAELGSAHRAAEIHREVVDKGFGSAVVVQNALINMYGKCGSVESAKAVFESMKARNVISWTAMLAAYARNGRPLQALSLHEEMAVDGTSPSLVTFTCVLAACSHAGLVEDGQKHLFSMNRDYGLNPSQEHYACVVDLLGRAGWLREAEQYIAAKDSEADDDVVWRALLSACKLHCDDEVGGVAAGRVARIVPDDTAAYVLLSNLHSELGEA